MRSSMQVRLKPDPTYDGLPLSDRYMDMERLSKSLPRCVNALHHLDENNAMEVAVRRS